MKKSIVLLAIMASVSIASAYAGTPVSDSTGKKSSKACSSKKGACCHDKKGGNCTTDKK